MGCNTSKDSVQPASEEAKEDVKNGGEGSRFYESFGVHILFKALIV